MRGKTNKGILFSNPNLLDNPWFNVNQIGQAIYTKNGYTLDRWCLWENADNNLVITRNDDNSITLHANIDQASSSSFYQKIEQFELGKIYTLSVMYSDGTVKSNTNQINSTEDKIYVNLDTTSKYGCFYLDFSNNYWCVTFGLMKANDEITIKAVKLELGSISTLHLDPPPNYVEELLKCQREFVRLTNRNLGYQSFATGVGNGVNQAVFNIHTPVPMRITPTISFSNLRIVGKGCDYVPVKSIQATDVVGSSVTALVTVDSPSTISNGEVYQISGNDVGIIDISARR